MVSGMPFGILNREYISVYLQQGVPTYVKLCITRLGLAIEVVGIGISSIQPTLEGLCKFCVVHYCMLHAVGLSLRVCAMHAAASCFFPGAH